MCASVESRDIYPRILFCDLPQELISFLVTKPATESPLGFSGWFVSLFGTGTGTGIGIGTGTGTGAGMWILYVLCAIAMTLTGCAGFCLPTLQSLEETAEKHRRPASHKLMPNC